VSRIKRDLQMYQKRPTNVSKETYKETHKENSCVQMKRPTQKTTINVDVFYVNVSSHLFIISHPLCSKYGNLAPSRSLALSLVHEYRRKRTSVCCCSVLQCAAMRCSVWQCVAYLSIVKKAHCNTLQHAATHCNTLQHTGILSCVPEYGRKITL